MVEIVVMGPQDGERGDGDQQPSLRLEQPPGLCQSGRGIRQVLEHVEHQNQPKAATRVEAGVERAEMDAGAIRAVRRDQALVRLDAPHLSKPGQLAEEQAVATPDVQDVAPTARRAETLDLAHQHFLAGTPPPMPIVEVAISGGVLWIQRPLSAATAS